MATERTRIPVLIGLVLALPVPISLLVPISAQAAGSQEAKDTLTPKAVAFVRTLAKGDFETAEANFTEQMKQAAPPQKLREIWQRLLDQGGSFQDTGDSKTIVNGTYTTVVVKTDFKSRALGIAVTFDSAQRIAGMHFVPPP
jgi:hypothetical protein